MKEEIRRKLDGLKKWIRPPSDPGSPPRPQPPPPEPAIHAPLPDDVPTEEEVAEYRRKHGLL